MAQYTKRFGYSVGFLVLFIFCLKMQSINGFLERQHQDTNNNFIVNRKMFRENTTPSRYIDDKSRLITEYDQNSRRTTPQEDKRVRELSFRRQNDLVRRNIDSLRRFSPDSRMERRSRSLDRREVDSTTNIERRIRQFRTDIDSERQTRLSHERERVSEDRMNREIRNNRQHQSDRNLERRVSESRINNERERQSRVMEDRVRFNLNRRERDSTLNRRLQPDVDLGRRIFESRLHSERNRELRVSENRRLNVRTANDRRDRENIRQNRRESTVETKNRRTDSRLTPEIDLRRRIFESRVNSERNRESRARENRRLNVRTLSNQQNRRESSVEAKDRRIDSILTPEIDVGRRIFESRLSNERNRESRARENRRLNARMLNDRRDRENVQQNRRESTVEAKDRRTDSRITSEVDLGRRIIESRLNRESRAREDRVRLNLNRRIRSNTRLNLESERIRQNNDFSRRETRLDRENFNQQRMTRENRQESRFTRNVHENRLRQLPSIRNVEGRRQESRLVARSDPKLTRENRERTSITEDTSYRTSSNDLANNLLSIEHEKLTTTSITSDLWLNTTKILLVGFLFFQIMSKSPKKYNLSFFQLGRKEKVF